MPYINDKRYLTLPQQVKVNKDDIVINQDANDATHVIMVEKNNQQDIDISQTESDVEQLQDAIAAGGVIVTRKIGLSANLAVTAIEAKIDWDVETEPSNEPTAVTCDVNNDHVLITDGKYKVEVPVSVLNGNFPNRIVTFNIYAQDTVTFGEVLIGTRDIDVGRNETVNTSIQVDYTKSLNNKAILVKLLGESLTVLQTSECRVTSYFTVAGSGVVTQTKNIAPTNVANEGILETEATLSDILKNLKDVLIEFDTSSGNAYIKRNGTTLMTLTGTAVEFASKKLSLVADPTSAQDAVTKAFMENGIFVGPTSTTELRRGGVVMWTINASGELAASGTNRPIKNVLDPTAAQDVVTKAFMENVVVGGTDTRLKFAGANAAIFFNTTLDLLGLRQITNILDPTLAQDAATKKYVDDGDDPVRESIVAQASPTVGVAYGFSTNLDQYSYAVAVVSTNGNSVIVIPLGVVGGTVTGIDRNKRYIDVIFEDDEVVIDAVESGVTLDSIQVFGIR